MLTRRWYLLASSTRSTHDSTEINIATELAGKGTWHPRSGTFKLVIRARLIITLETLVESGARHRTRFHSHPPSLPPGLSIDHNFLRNMVNVTWAPGLSTSHRRAIFLHELWCQDHAGWILYDDHVSILNSCDSSYHDWLYRLIQPRFSTHYSTLRNIW